METVFLVAFVILSGIAIVVAGLMLLLLLIFFASMLWDVLLEVSVR